MNDRALAKIDNVTQLAVPERPHSLLQFTHEQSQIIRDMCANGASESEFAFLMEIAKARGLNPLLKQIHFVKRWDSQKKRDVWSAQVGIDGFRSIADKTGLYDGQDEPEYGPLNERGFPQWAKVKVYKKGISRPFIGIAYWAEFVQSTREGNPTRFWAEMPMNQLAKCAESLALRKGFPEELGGLYTPEEMGQADNGERSPPRIAPHDDDGDDGANHDADVGADLLRRITEAKDLIPVCDSYDKALSLRALLGSKAKQSDLTREIQRAREARVISPEQYKEISKIWQHCDRQVAKLESALKTDAADAFTDPPDDGAAADPDGDGR